MYEPKAASGRDFQLEMRVMLSTMIPAYESAYAEDNSLPGLGPSLIKEFNDMLEFSAATVVGVSDRAQAVIDYLEHHYCGAPKPEWYAHLTR